jgi:hypothetical protein
MYFEGFIMSLILINSFLFMMKKSRQDKHQEDIIETINIVFFIIFCMEAFLKIICMGKEYFYDDYNKFDFFIVSLTIITMTIEKTTQTDSLGKETSILRIFRLGRVLRLVARASYFRMIFNTFINTLSSLIYIGLLLVIILFIYSVLGMDAFSFIKF